MKKLLLLLVGVLTAFISQAANFEKGKTYYIDISDVASWIFSDQGSLQIWDGGTNITPTKVSDKLYKYTQQTDKKDNNLIYDIYVKRNFKSNNEDKTNEWKVSNPTSNRFKIHSNDAKTSEWLSDYSEVTYSYQLHGDFGDLGWNHSNNLIFDNNLEATYDFTASGKQGGEFGIRKMEGNTQTAWYKGGHKYKAANSGTKYTLSTEGDNLKIDETLYGVVTFKLEVDSDHNPKYLTIKGGKKEEPQTETYTYRIHGQFKGDWNSGDIDFSQVNATTWTADYTFSNLGTATKDWGIIWADKNGQQMKDNSGDGYGWFVSTDKRTYDNDGQTYSLRNKTDNYNFQMSGVDGKVVFTLTVDETTGKPTALKITGGKTVTPPTPTPSTYTVYFYDQNEAANLDREVYAYVWKGSTKNAAYPGVKMVCESKENGKYVYVGGKYLPVWSYTFDMTTTPSNIIFSYKEGDSGAKKFVNSDLTFVNRAYYTNDGGYSSTLNLVTKKKDVVTLYIHMDQDWVKEGDGSAPRCHVSWDDNEYGGNDFTTYAEDEAMYLVEPDYQIWAFDIPKAKLDQKKYNNVHFYFPNKEDKKYIASYVGNSYDKDNWTKYIYAINKDNKAVQTYMTYDEFTEAAAKGYQNIYVVGGGDDGAKMEITVGNDTYELSWTNPTIVDRYLPTDPCFYLELTPSFGSSNNARFKITWVDVATAAKNNGNGKLNDERFWATFDLGIIGVDDVKGQTYTDASTGKKVLDIEDGHPGKSYMATDISFPLLEYNQYDWVLRNDRTTAGKKYYAIVDMHPACRTVSLMTFDPNPSVSVGNAHLTKEAIDLETAKRMHADHFHASTDNGHIITERVNFASGTATIKASNGLTVGNAGFDVEYSLMINKEVAAVYTGVPKEIELDHMPMAMDNDGVQIRARYIDKNTHLSSHSKIGSGDITLDETTFAKPKDATVTGRYVYEYTDEATGKSVYGVYVEGFNCNIQSSYNAYADFEFFKGQDFPEGYNLDKVVLMDKNHPIAKADNGIDGWEETWTPCDNEDDFTEFDETEDDNDWSSHLMKQGTAPVFIHDVARVDKPSDLEAISIKYNTYAVYPFLYNAEANYTFGSGAPRRAAGAGSTEYGDSYAIDYTYVPTHGTGDFPVINVGTGNIMTGLEEIGIETSTPGDAEYYTISGVRVQGQPAPGIYLMRQGDKVSKIVIR